jgi:hypothetical protein
VKRKNYKAITNGNFMADLVIINLHGGIIPLDGTPVVRNGFNSFLDRCGSRPVAISSYNSRDKVESDLKSAGLFGRVARAYTLRDMLHLSHEGIQIPDIRTWARRHFRTHETKALCISNNPKDIEGASWYGAQAVQIPTFMNGEDNFSFDKIPIDSLRARATYFFQRIWRKPQKIVLK